MDTALESTVILSPVDAALRSVPDNSIHFYGGEIFVELLVECGIAN